MRTLARVGWMAAAMVLWAAAAIAGAGASARVADRWSVGRAWSWYRSLPYPLGVNYIPASAINSTEMWQADTFDEQTIGAELALARRTGLNCLRVFVQYVVWENDRDGLLRRMDRFLSIADRNGMRVLFVLFDDCRFSLAEPHAGKQPLVIPGEYANGWTPSPGLRRMADKACWPGLAAYVRGVVGRFRADRRVLGWEAYNEAGNSGRPDVSLSLLRSAFVWARSARPTQPVTASFVVLGEPWQAIRRACLDLSDVISLHSYLSAPGLLAAIGELRALGRPILCTEWLNRPAGSRVESCLPALARQGVGAFHWGLVNGKTQTQYPWGSKAGAPAPILWQHDIYHGDRTPYETREVELFMKTARETRSGASLVPGQWAADRAWQWHASHPWMVGCNFLPASAVNDVEMWRAETFDPAGIDRELGWARALGFNTVRVFLNFVVWLEDAAGLKDRFARFLEIASRHGIAVMPILFDDCNFAGRVAAAGAQPGPIPGVHNSQWVSSPPLAMVTDRAAWPELERYVRDMVGAFRSDRRVAVWDLYNEPGNGPGETSRPLMEAAFAWARGEKPIQPLTVGAWTDFAGPFSQRMMELSDVASFHQYGGKGDLEALIASAGEHGRPLLCTEWMARTAGSLFETHLPIFKTLRVGCWCWGLTAGRTQTRFPWGSPEGSPEPALWHHDILRADGSPYRDREALFIKVTTGVLPASAMPARVTLVPTAATAPIEWRYTLDAPGADWFRAGFADGGWQRGAAPFGVADGAFARKPNTVWNGPGLWMRREFEMPAGAFKEVSLLVYHDEDVEVYINGVLALRASGYNASYDSYDMTPEGRAALRAGRNLMAVSCRQTTGGQYLDLGIEGLR